MRPRLLEQRASHEEDQPVCWEAHGHNSSHIQVRGFVHNALINDPAALIDYREENELDDLLWGELGGLPLEQAGLLS